MENAWINSRPEALSAAFAEAAGMLEASRLPLIAGLGTDIAGARAAIGLARRIGAAVDHMNSDALLRDLDVMREAGVMLTTPNETLVRADTLLLVGPGAAGAWHELSARLSGRTGRPDASDRTGRRIFCLCPERGGEIGHGFISLGRGAGELPVLLAALRARVNGRAIDRGGSSSWDVESLAGALKAARFGVAVWSAADLDPLAIEMLCGMVNDLNATTRFAGLPLAPASNAVGVLAACGWMTGFPLRTAFGRRDPEHDPWRYDATRLVDSGECDCVLWISAYPAPPPPWRADPPMIALAAPDAKFQTIPRIRIAVGCPGHDHDGVEHGVMTGNLVAVAAARKSETISVADAIARIAAHLSAGEPPC